MALRCCHPVVSIAARFICSCSLVAADGRARPRLAAHADQRGALPLHLCALVGGSPVCLRGLVAAHPSALTAQDADVGGVCVRAKTRGGCRSSAARRTDRMPRPPPWPSSACSGGCQPDLLDGRDADNMSTTALAARGDVTALEVCHAVPPLSAGCQRRRPRGRRRAGARVDGNHAFANNRVARPCTLRPCLARSMQCACCGRAASLVDALPFLPLLP